MKDIPYKKKTKIRTQIRNLILGVSVTALLITCAIGLSSMITIRSEGEKKITADITEDLLNTLRGKTMLADSELERYEGYVRASAGMAEDIYACPEEYKPKPVLPPDPEAVGNLTMQRYLKDPEINYEDVREELELLGNLEDYWRQIMEMEENITDIYIATESGGQLSYNRNSNIGAAEGESYFDYGNSEWYTQPKNTHDIYFTGVYEDSYNRGKNISCSAPVYYNGNFVAVVSIDILVDDLNEMLTGYNNKKGETLLIDRSGHVIATTSNNPVFQSGESIYSMDHEISSVAGQIVSAQEGIAVSEKGDFYAHSRIPTTNWYFCIVVPRDKIYASLRVVDHRIKSAISGFFIAFVVMVAAVILLARFFSASLTRPIDRLKEDVRIISSGNLDWRAKAESRNEIGDLAESFNGMAVSLKQYIEDLTRMTAERERIGAELSIAAKIQADMLPGTLPPFPERNELDLYATMDPAKEVGGDFYDFFLTDENHLALVMADVSGKGVPAALFMVIAKTLIMMRAPMGGLPSDILADVNEQLCARNDETLFVTVWLGILDITTGALVSANAGHEYPVVMTRKGDIKLIMEKHSPPLAAMEGLSLQDTQTVLKSGDKLFLYTDGVTEATDSEERLFGEKRLLEALNCNKEKAPEALLKGVRKKIDEFVGDAPQFDDITMLCMIFTGK
ncbi:MAG: SpoIIE family protein phosphatase [Lachnospiraceae bacterium]|nr:SpoIIE family protein phosphatase [Lachnospiraceae bacterium]